jgi:1-acyl-sn-glycerol-3-phosphate acyltransferase
MAGQARNDRRVFGRLSEFSPEKNKIIVFVFLIFTVVLFFFSFGTKFETNLQTINYMTDEQRTEMNKLIEENKGNGKTLYVVAEGKTTDEALENYELILPRLTCHSSGNPPIENGIAGQARNDMAVSGISNLFPSKELQKQKIERWNKLWEWNDDANHECSKKDLFIGNLKSLSVRQGFNENVFENFISTLNKDFQPQDFEYFAPIYNGLGENYFSISDDKTFIYTILNGGENQIRNIENQFAEYNDAVFVFDDSSIASKMVNALSNDFNNVLYICGFIVFVFLFFSFGRIELALLTFIPLTVGWVWILGLMNVFDLKFNIVNIILATFIFGQGDDYTIFVTEGLMYEYTYRKKMLASFKNSIILSAAILFIAIGMLIFAKHPAMRSLAELTIVGMVSVVMCAYLFPPLIFRFLTTKKGKPREVPWTLKRFGAMIYAFGAFLTGSILSTTYGFLLFGFRKNPSEKNKLRFHKLLRWEANFVIRRVPFVKFRYENLSGERFEKPAVIISNHQSHLDLMCLMMLTPKLIILTNDWVWRSPFYGQSIRYAEFYPVSQGIENSVPQLEDAVRRGYSVVIFPEGTRSADCSIGRFHRGAFYLAEKLGLDIVPVFLHGAGHVLPKNDFLLREGQITVQVRERIKPDKTIDYALRTKQIRKYYTETFAEICKGIETPDYFKRFVMYNYMYKGVEVWRGAKKEMRLATCDMRCATRDMRYEMCDVRCEMCDSLKSQISNPKSQISNLKSQISNPKSQIVIENSGYGVFAFMYALSHKDIQVIAVEKDEEKAAIAKNCAGVPGNLVFEFLP